MKKAFLQIHLAVLLWGFTGVLGKAISLSAPVLVWYRMLITALIIGGIITWRKEWLPVKRADFRKIIGIGIMYAVHWVAFYASIKYANASIAMVCLATASVFTALLDPLLNKGRFRTVEILLSFVAVGGVYCIYALQPHHTGTANQMADFQLGIALGVIASIISAIFTVLNKPLAERYPARNLVFYEMTTGLVFLSLLAPFYLAQHPAEALLPREWDYLWIFLLSYCCTVWGQSLAMSALKSLSAFTITLSVNLEPVYGVILAFLIFQENNQLGLGFYLGMALIFISLMIQVGLIVWKGRRKAGV
ncbi:DMT family transporter [Taibaiella chishuiensis]|uniref:Drug/metabolite transporter (DMT)-like permease n=1 Tax=Taibaiella chishuiensis TaxID=1434707 RepID=A0A2P8D5Y4_9BACT|nr:DMT family transporter [Taibaiella chishuiensis]PSK92601.1 drug/metabolite transporter (DMT)-like permease [Taibaiella chishuiensis]